MDAFRFGTAAFATFGLLGPLGGPYNTADWAKQLRASTSGTSEMLIYLVQFLWYLGRQTAGLGMWFFLLTDWSNVNYFIAIMALFFSYAVMDWYCWPGLYFYPEQYRNYWIVGTVYLLGWAFLVAAWILMLVQRAITTAGFFWTAFSLMAFSSLIGIILGVTLLYAYRSTFFMSARAPALRRG